MRSASVRRILVLLTKDSATDAPSSVSSASGSGSSRLWIEDALVGWSEVRDWGDTHAGANRLREMGLVSDAGEAMSEPWAARLRELTEEELRTWVFFLADSGLLWAGDAISVLCSLRYAPS